MLFQQLSGLAPNENEGTTDAADMKQAHEINALEPNARQRLLETATELFADRGYAGTSVREIVDRAGVSKPVLYYYKKVKRGFFMPSWIGPPMSSRKYWTKFLRPQEQHWTGSFISIAGSQRALKNINTCIK